MREDRLKSHTPQVQANSLVRCAIYARFSSDNQNESSITDQIRNCRELAARKGWTILDDHIYTDMEKTGTTVHGREGFARLMETAKNKAKSFDRILCDTSSRFGRNKPDVLKNLEILKFHRIYIFFVEDGLDSAEHWFERVVDLNAQRDQDYSRSLSHNVRRGLRGHFLDGYHTGQPCYGYKTDLHEDSTRRGEYGRPKVLGVWQVIDLEEARVIVRIFESYTGGMTMRRIAEMLNRDGIPTAMNSRSGRLVYWTKSAIAEMLKNRRYIGETTWGKTRQERDPETGLITTKVVDVSEWEHKNKPELRIISDELFHRVQERMKQQNKKFGLNTLGGLSRATSGRIYLFSGLLKCGTCSGRMTITATNPPRYGCSRHRESNTCVNNVTIKVSDLEEQFLAALTRNLESSGQQEEIALAVWNRVRNAVANQASPADARKQLEAEMKSLDGQRRNVMTALRTLGLSPSLEVEIREVDAQIARVATEMAALPSSPKKAITEEGVKNLLTGAMSRLKETLRAEPEIVRNYFRQVIQSITLMPTEDERGRVYKVTGDVGLFTSSESAEQYIRVEPDVLHYTIPIAVDIVPYRINRRNKITGPAVVHVSAESIERGQFLGIEAIWRKAIAIDPQAFLGAGITALKKRGELQVGTGSESHNPDSEEYLYLLGFGGLRLAAMAA